MNTDLFLYQMIDFHTDFTDFTEGRIATLAAVGFAECLQPAGKRECNDAFFVRLPLAPSGGEHVS